ncbi:hypothetical protein BDZ91DRAFT_738959 [Kalaharituber pfeilii]|nr:hypothetical protein BDZ91DRAFT_738959 [Kalaharituber pfeilii]
MGDGAFNLYQHQRESAKEYTTINTTINTTIMRSHGNCMALKYITAAFSDFLCPFFSSLYIFSILLHFFAHMHHSPMKPHTKYIEKTGRRRTDGQMFRNKSTRRTE